MTNEQFFQRLNHEHACLIMVLATQGSAPRDPGAWMAVFNDAIVGTIGGGHLEFAATAEARRRLAGGHGESTLHYALGPALGQCCGGNVQLRFEVVGAADSATLRQRLLPGLVPVALFGAGHVGHALMEVLGRLPLALSWIDSRDEIFPPGLPASVDCQYSDPVQAAVPLLAAGSRVLVMSFSHAEDLDVVAQCLLRQRRQADLPYIGLIGSHSKWATFRHRLSARGFSAQELAHVTCPIGVPGIASKQPEVIAVAVAAQILQGLARTADPAPPAA